MMSLRAFLGTHEGCVCDTEEYEEERRGEEREGAGAGTDGLPRSRC